MKCLLRSQFLAFVRGNGTLTIQLLQAGAPTNDSVTLTNFSRFGDESRSVVTRNLEFADGSTAELATLLNRAPQDSAGPVQPVQATAGTAFSMTVAAALITDADSGNCLQYPSMNFGHQRQMFLIAIQLSQHLLDQYKRSTRMTSAAKFSFGVLAATVVAAVAYVVYVEQLVRYWDRTIDELCAADGGKNVGLRVYERVMAPEHYFRPATGAQPADIFVPHPYRTPTNAEPIIERMVETDILRDMSPRVAKFSVQIVRVSDKKVLAEEIRYMRGGGGVPMPDPGDSHSCPEIVASSINTRAIYNEVFVNHPINHR